MVCSVRWLRRQWQQAEYVHCPWIGSPSWRVGAAGHGLDAVRRVESERLPSLEDVARSNVQQRLGFPLGLLLLLIHGLRLRSEERRVGNECRSRWSPYH